MDKVIGTSGVATRPARAGAALPKVLRGWLARSANVVLSDLVLAVCSIVGVVVVVLDAWLGSM